MAGAIVKRGRKGLGRKRGRRNPDRGPFSWGWLIAGAGIGAVGGLTYSLFGPGYQEPKPTDVALQTAAGAGAGTAIFGLMGGIAKSSPTTAVFGLVIGGGLAVAAYYGHLNQPAIATS